MIKPPFSRNERIASLIKTEIATLLINGCKDPRLSKTTITDVSVSADLQHAKVYFGTFDNSTSLKEISSAFNKASNFFRGKIAEALDIKKIPQLSFIYDSSLDHAEKIHGLLNKIKKQASENKDTDENP